jgi:hypothetical protein
MDKDVITASELIDVSDRSENGVPENEVPGTEVPENDVNSGSCTVVAQNEPENEWFRDGNAWVKLFLEPIAPGKFRQHDYIYNVPGENEFPKEQWSSKECQDGFHITRRRNVSYHLPLHNYKSAYIAEVVSMGDEFYDTAHQRERKVRVVAFGPAVPLVEVLGKHPRDFKEGHMLLWSAVNNHIDLVELAVSKKQNMYIYGWAFGIALENGSDQIAEFLLENCKNTAGRQEMLYNAIRYGRVDYMKRLMENTSVDVSFYRVACFNGQFESFQLLRAKYGEPKCSDIILAALDGGNVDILKYIKSRDVDMSDFEMFVYACTNYDSSVETVEYLVSEGADVKHPMIAYIAKKHAFNEVGEYLLTQIDDKSEVNCCDKLEEEIAEIRENFLIRIKAGEFDGE